MKLLRKKRWPHVRRDRQAQRNIHVLMRYLAIVVVVVLVFTQLFHVLMEHFEGRTYSWITGLYWTLTVMTTLGFGDITFTSDVGRIFSIVVLNTGILLLFLVLPFVFIRIGPWLEARFRMTAPTYAPPGTSGHVVLCAYDPIAPGLIHRLEREEIPYFIIEGDETRASELYTKGFSVIRGAVDRKETYEAVRANRARLVFANRSDIVNTNIILTVHEVAPETPVVALADQEHAIDVLELSGATKVLPLKRWLGEQLANRVNAMHAEAHAIGRYEDLLIAELALHRTPLAGKTIRETRLRENTGVSIVGVWERGVLLPAHPDYRLSETTVAVVVGTEQQLEELNNLLLIYDFNPNPVLVIGGGVVGGAAIRALGRKGVPVHLVERDPQLCTRYGEQCKAVFTGDAADYDLLQAAGIMEAPSVLLSTNDDAMNIFLASYCRHLNPELRIVSRVTYERNVEALHRAGADFVLSYYTLGVDAVFSIIKNRELIVIGERVDLFSVSLPKSLAGKTLAESGIGAKTGLNVIAVREDGKVITNITPATRLMPGMELIMIGDYKQRALFSEIFGDR